MARYIFVVHSDPREGQEDKFKEWYEQHLVNVTSKLGPFPRARLYRALDKPTPLREELRYLTIYEIETDDIEGIPQVFMSGKADGLIHRDEAFNEETDTWAFFEQISEAVAPE